MELILLFKNIGENFLEMSINSKGVITWTFKIYVDDMFDAVERASAIVYCLKEVVRDFNEVSEDES